MKIYVPEDLRLFTASHRKYGKCQIEFSASTGTVVSKEERTTTRVYGDSRSVGSTVSVDQALWIQFEDGSEQCINIQNDNTRLARPGHSITFLNAKNSKNNNSLYVAFLNHATKDFHYFQYGLWTHLLWGDKRLGFLSVLWISFLSSLILSAAIGLLFMIIVLKWGKNGTVRLDEIFMFLFFCTGGFMIPIGIPFSLICHSSCVWNSADKVKAHFKKQIAQIIKSFREQLG